jgi:hypothetical protein
MTEPEVHAPVTGASIGPWRILERMGSGTFGIVYRVCLAEEPGAGEYALKLAREPADPRFERETELLGRLRHPHVPGLRDHGIWQGDRHPGSSARRVSPRDSGRSTASAGGRSRGSRPAAPAPTSTKRGATQR